MKIIIRIEHPETGEGIFHTQIDGKYLFKQFSFFEDFRELHREFPCPLEDLGRFIDDNEFCAFKSIDQFQEWIKKEWISEILSVGFNILMIDVSECIEGEMQILYKKEYILQTKIINSLFV